MAFNVNIFGTTHGQPENNLFYFNLHVISVTTQFTPPISFNMFLSFYAFPFNTDNGSRFVAALDNGGNVNLPNRLSDRLSVKKPQIVHINTMSATTQIQLFNCLGIPSSSLRCSANQIAVYNSLPPCPVNPEDIRIYSNTFCVPIQGNPASPSFNTNWTNMTNVTGQRSFAPNTGSFLLPIDITIIADGCYYLSKSEISKVKIYNPFTYVYNSTSLNPYGNINCLTNPNFYQIGKDDIITVS